MLCLTGGYYVFRGGFHQRSNTRFLLHLYAQKHNGANLHETLPPPFSKMAADKAKEKGRGLDMGPHRQSPNLRRSIWCQFLGRLLSDKMFSFLASFTSLC